MRELGCVIGAQLLHGDFRSFSATALHGLRWHSQGRGSDLCSPHGPAWPPRTQQNAIVVDAVGSGLPYLLLGHTVVGQVHESCIMQQSHMRVQPYMYECVTSVNARRLGVPGAKPRKRSMCMSWVWQCGGHGVRDAMINVDAKHACMHFAAMRQRTQTYIWLAS